MLSSAMPSQKPGPSPGCTGAGPILFVDGSPAIGGATRVLTTLLDHVDRERSGVLVACSPASGLGEAVGARADDVALIDMPLLTFAVGARGALPLLYRYARACGALSRLIRAHRPRLVWANGFMGALYGSIPSRLAGVPMVWHVHDVLPIAIRNRPFVRCVAAASSAIACVSEAALKRLGEIGVPARKCRVIHNAVAEPHGGFLPAAVPAPHSILAAGALTPLKGHDVLVEAMREVVRCVPDATLDIAGEVIFPGDASYAQELRAAVQAAGLDGCVRFLGFVDDVDRRMDGAALVVHPSRGEETFGLVPLEAMSRGRPVVATRIGGIPEVVEDGVTGLLIPPGDAPALARAILDLFGDEGLRERLGGEGRRVARERFGPRPFVEGLNGVARSLVGEALFNVATRGGARASTQDSSSA